MPTKIYVNLPVKDLARPTFTEPFFRSFTTRELADTSKTTEAIVALEVDTRQQVDEMARRAST